MLSKHDDVLVVPKDQDAARYDSKGKKNDFGIKSCILEVSNNTRTAIQAKLSF